MCDEGNSGCETYADEAVNGRPSEVNTPDLHVTLAREENIHELASSNMIVVDGYKLHKPLIWRKSEPVSNTLPRRDTSNLQSGVRLPLDHGNVTILIILPYRA